MNRRLIIGTRGSKLAMIQAESVAARIREANPHLEINLREIVTSGDRNRRTRLDWMGTNVFVKELEEGLLDSRIDIAVHSLKDVPTDIPQGLALLAVTERLDPRDVLISGAGSLDELPPGARIGTGSLRRTIQLGRYRPDLQARPIRGNIDTRLRKVAFGEYEGVILAAAAMIRLGWHEKITEYLPLDPFLPAAGQGALAVEGRSGDVDIAEMVAAINHLPTWQSINAERVFLKAVGGGCRAPMATLGTVDGTTLELEGMIADPEGREVLYASETGDITSTERVGIKLAERMQDMGASRLIAEDKSI